MEEELREDKRAVHLASFIQNTWEIPGNDIRTYSPLVLAYIGDAIYDIIIRTIMVEKGNAPVNKLHKQVTKLVQAAAQAQLFHQIEEQLTEEERAVYKRGRNAKSFSSAKNAEITDYRIATGFEALVGYLYLMNRMERIMELLQPVIKI